MKRIVCSRDSTWYALGMIQTLLILSVLILLSACGGDGNGDGQTDGPANYSGQIEGVTATGACTFEDNRNVGGLLRMSCEIQSGAFTYLFNAEMVNPTVGFADMTELPTGNRIRIQVEWTEANYPPSGFTMTLNPFGPGPTVYQFARV